MVAALLRTNTPVHGLPYRLQNTDTVKGRSCLRALRPRELSSHVVFLESFQCSAADDDVDGDPDDHDGDDAGDALVYVDADTDAGDDAEESASHRMGVEDNERAVRMRGAM